MVSVAARRAELLTGGEDDMNLPCRWRVHADAADVKADAVASRPKATLLSRVHIRLGSLPPSSSSYEGSLWEVVGGELLV